MSTVSIDPVNTLMKISPSMLIEYAKYHDINLNLKEGVKSGEPCARNVLNLVGKEPEEKEGAFLMDLDDIDSMGREEICLGIANKLQAEGKPLGKEVVEKFAHWDDWSMHFYLHHKELFYSTFDDLTLDMKQGWKGRKTVAVPFDDFIGNIEAFKRALKLLYQQEYKGDKVSIRLNNKGDRAIFTAYIQGVFTVDTAFKDGSEDLKNNKPRKPVFPINFLYRPAEGILEIKAQGGRTRLKELQGIFIVDFLKEDPSTFAKSPRFDFDKVKNLTELEFPFTTQDKVESVILKGLKLVDKKNKMQIAIDIEPKEKTGVEPMLDALKKRQIIDLNEFEIIQFKIKVLFKKPLKGKQRSVTTTITYPDGCNLKQREIDVVVYQLLKKWGLVFY